MASCGAYECDCGALVLVGATAETARAYGCDRHEEHKCVIEARARDEASRSTAS